MIRHGETQKLPFGNQVWLACLITIFEQKMLRPLIASLLYQMQNIKIFITLHLVGIASFHCNPFHDIIKIDVMFTQMAIKHYNFPLFPYPVGLINKYIMLNILDFHGIKFQSSLNWRNGSLFLPP